MEWCRFMARWSNSRDANGGNCDEKCKGKCNCGAGSVNPKSFREGNDDEDGMPGQLFDQIVLVLLRRLYAKNAVRAIPVLLGGGRSVDLFSLFYLVREKGGFNSVSRGYLWGLVAKKVDLDFRFSASLKMVYFNYLGDLDQWLDSRGKGWNLMKMSHEYDRNLKLLSIELKKRFSALYVHGAKLVNIDKEVIPDGCDKICNTNSIYIDDANVATVYNDEKIVEGDRSLGGPGSLERDSKRKRKHGGWKEMLSWLNRTAKNPCHLSNGRIQNGSKWKENGGREYWSLVLFAREAMLKRKYLNSNNDGCCPQKKQKIHPSIYDDPASRQLPGIRFSKRVPALAKSPNCPCCISSLTKESRAENHSKAAHLENEHEDNEEKTPDPPASSLSEPTDGLSPDETSPDEQPFKKHVNVGPQFQAEIPSWTVGVSQSDYNWLGTRVWAPDNWKQNTAPITQSMLGKGRPDICDCPFPSSVECVRFHTAENRLKLKNELGRAFYQWKFDRMGELVSLSWTPQEEEEFKSVMTATPLSMGKSSFPKKTKQELVDYYFNVFLQHKRSYQNRVTPNNIDSDDELSEFGSVGGLYGHAAIITSGSNPGSCTQNEECLDVNFCEGNSSLKDHVRGAWRDTSILKC